MKMRFNKFLFTVFVWLLQSELKECHVNDTMCGLFNRLYSTCLTGKVTYKVYSTMLQETDFMCDIINSVSNCLNNVKYMDLQSNGLVNCTCVSQEFTESAHSEEYHFYKPLARLCTDSELYPQLQSWLNATNSLYTKVTSVDYSTLSEMNVVYDLYCKNYGWYDWHTNVTQNNHCIGSTSTDELLNCYKLHAKNISNHNTDDVRAISASLINCYLIESAKYCTADMQKMIAVFGINDIENEVNYVNRLRVDEFFIEADVKSCKRSTVGVLADRHIIPYNLQYNGPCSFTGEMVCLKNKYFQINCESSVIDTQTNKTAITGIKVKIYSDNLMMGQYTAVNGTLGGLFSNEKRYLLNMKNEYIAFVANLDTSNIVLVDVLSRTLIEINVLPDKTYFFLLRAPNDVLQLSYGLLRSNCLRTSNETKDTNSSVCNQINSDPHFNGQLSAWRATLVSVCEYDVEKFQNESLHKKIHTFVHNADAAASNDLTIINDPLSLLFLNNTSPIMTQSTPKATLTTTQNSATAFKNRYLKFISISFILWKLLL